MRKVEEYRVYRHAPTKKIDNDKIELKIITKRVIRPSDFEIKVNPRARSAKLRVAEKI